ncbi:hypothetical protein ABPG75_001356 [Micractinium tetrahymenae]
MHAQPPQFALRRLNFVPAQRQDAHAVSEADLRNLIPLNDPVEAPAEQAPAMGRKGAAKAAARQARKELFSAEELSLEWREMRKAGVGLQNLGNTCFMNSVLQSLVHTPPLAELLLSAGSGRLHNGAVNGFYPIQLAQELVKRSLGHASRSPLAPMQFAKSLRRISRSFRPGRQEDAHEFLIALLDVMHEASIAGMQPKPPPEVAQTSFIYRIFGGRMRSQVKCSECGYESNTYDPCIDLSLEITRAQSVKRALERFTAGEVLDGQNKYKCPKQSKGVRAVKRMTVDAAPNVLMIQLKRFEFSFSGHKISKKVDFDLDLDLGPYMSERPAAPALYDLYAVLVHSGHSVHSGHYYSYVRAPNGIWHICDDTHVAQVAERQVMAQKAYILFYKKRQHGGRALPPAPGKAAPASKVASTPAPGPSPAPAVSTAAMRPASARPEAPQAALPLRRQDVQQQQQQQQQQQAQQAKQQAKQAKQQQGRREGPAPTATAAPAAAAAAAEGGVFKKRKRREAEEEGPAAAAGGEAHLPSPRRGEEEEERRRQQLQNGHISKKPRLKALKRRVEEEGHLPSPLLLRRMPSPLLPGGFPLLVGRSGSRLAEAVTIAAHAPSRKMLKRIRAAAAAAAAATAAAPQAAAAATPLRQPKAAQEDSGGSSGASEGQGASGATTVVSAPDWPPVRQQQTAVPGDGSQQQQQQQQQQKRKLKQQRQQQQERQQQAAASPPAATTSGQAEADVRTFLRRSGGGTALPLQAWDDASAEAKRHKAVLERQELPKRRRQDDYDLEYDRGKVKKVRSKPAAGEGDGEGGADFDAAWSRKQREGVVTELRGNRKRRSADFKQQQQRRQDGRRHGGGGGRGWGRGPGGHGRPSFGGRNRR